MLLLVVTRLAIAGAERNVMCLDGGVRHVLAVKSCLVYGVLRGSAWIDAILSLIWGGVSACPLILRVSWMSTLRLLMAPIRSESEAFSFLKSAPRAECKTTLGD